MTETDFFRVAREKLGEYALFIARDPALLRKPYFVTLRVGVKLYHANAETPAEALHDVGRQASLEFSSKPRDTTEPDTRWPNG